MDIHKVFSVIRGQGVSSDIWNSLSRYNDSVQNLIFSFPTNCHFPIGTRFFFVFVFLIKSYYAGAAGTYAAGIAKCPSRIWHYVHHWPSFSHRVAQKEKVSFFFCTDISSFNSWRRKRLPTAVFWTGEFQLGLQRVRHDWATFTFQLIPNDFSLPFSHLFLLSLWLLYHVCFFSSELAG